MVHDFTDQGIHPAWCCHDHYPVELELLLWKIYWSSLCISTHLQKHRLLSAEKTLACSWAQSMWVSFTLLEVYFFSAETDVLQCLTCKARSSDQASDSFQCKLTLRCWTDMSIPNSELERMVTPMPRWQCPLYFLPCPFHCSLGIQF
jgi:hypothetical protein